jgi:protein-export membrane protein SecD
VDANVLIFERIKEEARLGKTPFAAVDAGYKRALTTIIDANVTTLIAAVLLLQFGSGPVKGFAWTLAIGVVTSMFTAVTLTRLLVALWLRRARPTQLPI